MNEGGYIAVLAIEGLFGLIVNFNLDYPKYFEALYSLCTPSIFAAKYHSKFLELLGSSLKSTNIPAYTAAAFIKKFAFLALHGQAPTACFCVAMVITLLRAHPKCMVMIHNKSKGKKGAAVLPLAGRVYKLQESLDDNNGKTFV